jgi:phosphatidate cytidylyltransferase
LPDDASRAPPSVAKARRWGDLLPRVLSGVVMVALALLTAVVGGHLFALFWLIAAVAVCWEWQHLIGHEGATRRFALGAAALAVAGALCVADRVGFALVVLGVGMLGAGALAPAPARLMAALGMVYAGALLVSVIVLRFSFPGGLEAILWLFAVVWGTDVMAYFGGRFLGGPRPGRDSSSGLVAGHWPAWPWRHHPAPMWPMCWWASRQAPSPRAATCSNRR